ncbi:uncharacterized protein LOC132259627 [Phlebotomus argentipes]|uniref:uncharacterized protein LOC132259627 n=1 Tax=Phlebotomus argentipes TaxID=94469 RepID=UPI002893225A|nr:uncharacterized protein LOC132259627 [Phlebotomus argentipes]
MGRKNRHSLITAQKSSAGGQKKGKAAGKGALNKTKKAKNVFKVATKKNKAKKAASNIQKGKAGKKEALQNKSEKLNESLKTLHKDMVVKKKAAPKATPAKASPKGRKSQKKAPQTKDVEAGLSSLDV